MARNVIEDPNLETPNTKGTELQNQVQQNTKYVVQPNAYNYAQTSKPTQSTQSTQPTQPTKPTTITAGEPNNAVTTNVQQQNTIQPTVETKQVAVKTPSDLNDSTVQGYLNDYRYGVSINDYQAQINALNALDQYRIDKGYEPIYTDTVYELTNRRTEKIKNAISEFDRRIAEAYNSGNYEEAQAIGQELLDYKKMTNYNDTPQTYNPRDVADYMANLEYRSNYDGIINGIVSELLTARFTYNPAEDEALIKAQQYAANTAMEKMNARGLLNSSMTAQIVTATIAQLQPTYEKMAREEFYENIERLQSMANFIVDLDDRQYKRWLEEVDRNLAYYSALKDEVSYMWDRVNQMGYVDNEASLILGVAPGSLSPSARQAIQEQDAKTQNEYNKLMSDIALAQAKAELDVETYRQKQAIETSNYATKKYIDNQYKNSNSNNGTSTDIQVSDNTRFTGQLDGEYLKSQLNVMASKKSQDEAKWDMIYYARANAKNREAWLKAIGGGDYYEGWTEAEANEILNEMAEYSDAIKTIDEKINSLYETVYQYTPSKEVPGEVIEKLIGEYINEYEVSDDVLGAILANYGI